MRGALMQLEHRRDLGECKIRPLMRQRLEQGESAIEHLDLVWRLRVTLCLTMRHGGPLYENERFSQAELGERDHHADRNGGNHEVSVSSKNTATVFLEIN